MGRPRLGMSGRAVHLGFRWGLPAVGSKQWILESMKRWVSVWLFVGLVMVGGQILIGGVTRLTGSGLSITKWEIVTGTLPPLNATQWEEEFKLYQATPQYALINKGMSMQQFKFIYFWEYFHRLWARVMGLVFLFPFLYFLRKGALDQMVVKRLLVLVGLAAVTASFGWIMVASGLIQRPWVNAYKLSMHLLLGFSVFLWLFHIWYRFTRGKSRMVFDTRLESFSGILFVLVLLQIVLGGLMSGMKAGFAYPTWPDMHGEYLPSILLSLEEWKLEHFIDYDNGPFMNALVQFTHRGLAYIVLLLGLIYTGFLYLERDVVGRSTLQWAFLGFLVLQVTLGILTVLAFRNGVPVALGSMHQLCGLALLTVLYHHRFLVFRQVQ